MKQVESEKLRYIQSNGVSASALGTIVAVIGMSVLIAIAFKLYSPEPQNQLLGVVIAVLVVGACLIHVYLSRFFGSESHILDNALTEEQIKTKKLEAQAKKLAQDLVKSQDTLIHSEKMASLGQLSAGVAHEINNPVGFMMSNMCTLKEYMFFLDCLTKQLLDLMGSLSKQEKLKHEELIKQIEQTLKIEDLDFVLEDANALITESIDGGARIKSITNGMKGYTHESTDEKILVVNELIEQTLTIAWNQIKYNCELEKDLQSNASASLEPGAFNQVLLNIMMNASHAMEGSAGLLRVRSYDKDGNVVIEIEDTGHGISEENLGKIFDPFFTTKPVGQGTGLGMSISYDIIKRFRGDLSVQSELGKGTCFTIVLPAIIEDALKAS